MADMTTSVHFSIKYDGPALADHRMDVRELAPALIALANLLEEANTAVYPDGPEVRVNVQGNFKGGSFGVDLLALQSIGQQIVSMLAGPNATAAANLLAILGGVGLLGRISGGGLIALIKFLRGRKPTTVRTDDDRVVFEVREVEVVESFEVDLVTHRLYQSRIVRQALARVLKPLEREGIDVFACGKDGKTEAVVTKEDLPAFTAAAEASEVVSDNLVERVLLQIESAVFKDENKWRFHDGAQAFFAEITDREFIARVATGEERFGKGDVLVVDLRRVQHITDNGLKVESFVERVHEHRAPVQQALLS
jgi:hypothetical protein